MAGSVEQGGSMPDYAVPGYAVLVHRALTEPILLGGAPRAIAIMNGTLAGAVGLGLRLWIAGLAIWAIGPSLPPSGPPSARRVTATSLAGHPRIPAHLTV